MENRENSFELLRRREFLFISTIIVFLLVISAISEANITGVPQWFKEQYTKEPVANNTTPTGSRIVDVELLSNNGYTQEGTKTDINFKIEQESVLQLNITLAWIDDYGNNDEFSLSLTQENNKIDSVQGITGELKLQYNNGNDTIPKGNYTISISAINCPGLIPNSPIDRDQGNSWTVTVTMAVRE
jgi:hypothetical protein